MADAPGEYSLVDAAASLYNDKERKGDLRMKKFLTYISMQPEKALLKVNYSSVDNEELDDELEVFFPISKLIKTYAEKEEAIQVICLIEDGNENAKRNMSVLDKEIQAISREEGFSYDIKTIIIPNDETSKTHLNSFMHIIEEIDDGDELYACATYGTKPIPIIEFMALNFAYRIKDDVSIKHVVYGKINRDTDGQISSGVIYDITSLFFMTQIINKLAEQGINASEDVLKKMISADLED